MVLIRVCATAVEVKIVSSKQMAVQVSVDIFS